jgi:hypothetical protein
MSPIVGSAEDFTIEVMTELGSVMKNNSLSHVSIDDEHLAQEARDLPQLIFYYQAAYSRIVQREEQTKIQLDESESQAWVRIKSSANATGDKMPADEVKARITLDPIVQELRRKVAELTAKAGVVKGILDSLRQKGYSLQLLGNLKVREEDWLRRSFSERFSNHPEKQKIGKLINHLFGVDV